MARAIMFSLLAFFTYCFVCLAGQGSDTTCKDKELPCEDGRQCIPYDSWCNKKNDCRDGSDEKFCKNSFSTDNKCNASFYFKCNNGKCIPKKGVCDGLDSCGDESDEENCNKVLSNYLPSPRTDFYTHRMLDRARLWLKLQRQQNYGWGDNTHRAVIAWHLSKSTVSDETEELLMTKQLETQLAIGLARDGAKRMSNTDLSLYINALLSACRNPCNFYGFDLVQMLRDRVDHSYTSKNYRGHQRPNTSPLVILTLCIHNHSKHNDFSSLQEMTQSRNLLHHKLDIYSIALMAIQCMKNVETDESILHRVDHVYDNIHKMMLQKIHSDGFPGNIYEVALLFQALNGSPEDAVLKDEAMQFIKDNQLTNGSFGDILATYYVLPILSGKSLFSLRENCQKMTPGCVSKDKAKYQRVTYALEYAEPLDYTQVLHLNVAEGTNLLGVMQLAEKRSANYRFKMDNDRITPTVYSIGGIPNDAEKGMYWCLHFKRANETTTTLIPYLKGVIPVERDVITFKYTNV